MGALLQARRRIRPSALAPVVLACLQAPTDARAQVVLLPAVNTTTGESEAYAINDAGRVVGQTTASNPGPPRLAAQWVGGALNVLPSPAGAPLGGQQGNVAFGINNNGVAVGTAAWPTASSVFAGRAVRWDNGVATDLGSAPGASVTQARAINNNGEIAGSGIGSTLTAVRWTPSGTLQTLALLPTHENSFAWDINASGRIVGQSGIGDFDFSTESNAVYWDGTSVTALATPASFNQSLARGINDAGTIVGTSSTFDFNDTFTYTAIQATVWDGATPTLLPLLSGLGFSTAQSINADGLIIGAAYADADSATFGEGVPVLWDGGAVTDLRPLLAPSFASGARFRLTDINAAGQISGFAVTETGAQGFILTVPTSGAAGLLAMGGLFASRRRRAAR